MEWIYTLNGVPSSALQLNQIVTPVFFSGKYLRVFRKTNDRPGDAVCFFWWHNYGSL